MPSLPKNVHDTLVLNSNRPNTKVSIDTIVQYLLLRPHVVLVRDVSGMKCKGRVLDKLRLSPPLRRTDELVGACSMSNSKEQLRTYAAGAEQRLNELGIKLPLPPEPFGAYVEAVQTGNLLFLSGMLPTEGRAAKFIGRIGAELDVEAGRRAARLAALNGLAVARDHLGSLDKISRVVRLGVSVATSGDIRAQPRIADAASELLLDIFGKEKSPCRLVYGVASLPLGTPVELEIIFEVAG